MSTITDYTDRNTCVLFGDAAGAVLLDVCHRTGPWVFSISSCTWTAPASDAPLYEGRRQPKARLSTKPSITGSISFTRSGANVFKTAVTEMANVSAEILEKNGLTGNDVGLFVPHQANLSDNRCRRKADGNR